MPMWNWGRTYASAVAGNNILANATPVTNIGTDSIVLPTITTTLTNCTIVVIVAQNGQAGIPTVTAPGLTFTPVIDDFNNTGAGNNISSFIAVAASTGTYTITCTTTNGSGGGYIEAIAFAFSGVTTTAPTDGAVATNSSPVTLLTTNANDVLVFGSRNGTGSGTGNPTSPWISVPVASQFMIASYQIVTATQPGISIADTSGSSSGTLAFGLKST